MIEHVSASSERSASSWRFVVLLGAVTALGPLSIDMYLPSLPAIATDLRASAAQTQGTVAVFLAGMAIGQFLYGPASDRVGRRRPLLIGVTIYVAASIACALAGSPTLLVCARLVQALGACAGAVIGRAIVRDRFGHAQTARILSLMMLIVGLAPILAPILGGALLVVGGWRLNFGFMSLIGAALGITCFFRLRESRSAEIAAHAETENLLQVYMALLRQRRLIGYALAGGLNGATLFTYVSSAPELLINAYGIPPTSFGYVFAINGLGLVGGSQVNRFLLHSWTPDQLLARSSFVAVGVAAVLLAVTMMTLAGPLTVLPLLFLVVSSYGFIQGNTMAGALSVDPKRAGATSALLGASSFAMGGVASAIAGLLHDGTARPMAAIMVAALAGSTASLHLLALPKGTE